MYSTEFTATFTEKKIKMKFLLTFFVAFLAIHGSIQSPVNADDENTQQKIVKVLNEVLNVTQILLDDAKAFAEDFKKDPSAFSEKIITDLSALGNETVHDIISLIDQLGPNATADGKAVIVCIDAEESAIDDLLTITFTTGINCGVAPNYGNISEVVDSLLSDLQDLQTDMQTQTTTLDKCSQLEVSCLLGFVTTVIQTIEKAVPIAEQYITDIYNLVAEVVDDVNQCDIVPSIKDGAQQVFNEAVQCIKT
ncbi:hypothetical protein ABEB36_004123 [Hypothenemus hampei]|uniref:Uncharacterized protein n=1 Tax=Hypothenemus hampei TaxID=57062 RepID=A0ABD1F296_HYPHA